MGDELEAELRASWLLLAIGRPRKQQNNDGFTTGGVVHIQRCGIPLLEATSKGNLAVGRTVFTRMFLHKESNTFAEHVILVTDDINCEWFVRVRERRTLLNPEELLPVGWTRCQADPLDPFVHGGLHAGGTL